MKKTVAILGLLLAVLLPVCVSFASYNTSIVADTNGFDSYVYVPVPPANITEITNQGSNITYYEVGVGTIFLTSEGETYNIITPDALDFTPWDQIEVNDTIYVNADTDFYGKTYVRGAGLGEFVQAFNINGSNIEVKNLRYDAMRYVSTVADIAITGDNVDFHHVEILNSSKYTFTFQGSNGSKIHNCLTTRGQYGISGSNTWSYNGEIYDNAIMMVSRNGIKVKGFDNFTIRDNLIFLDQGDFDNATKIGVEFSTDFNSTGVLVENNTIILVDKSQPANAWGINYNYLAGKSITDVNSSGNKFVNLDLGIWTDTGSTGLNSSGDEFIQCTTDFTDNGNNWINNTVSHDEPYYTDLSPFVGAYGNATLVYNGTNLPGEQIHYGLFPAVYTEYQIGFSWYNHTSGVYFYIAGTKLTIQNYATSNVRIYFVTQDGTEWWWTDNTHGGWYFDMRIIVDTQNHGMWIFWDDDDEGAAGRWLDFYYNKFDQDHNAHLFTSTHIYVDERDDSVANINYTRQYIFTRNFVEPIGSIHHQAFGLDGVRDNPESKVYAGIEDVQALGDNMTLFMDDGYMTNQTFLDFMKNTTFELGVHFNPTTLNTIANDEFVGNVTAQNDTIATEWGLNPKSYAVLGVGWLSNSSRLQFMDHNMSMVRRSARYVMAFPTSEKLDNSSFNYVDNGTTAGFAVVPLYTHETEVHPPAAGEIDGVLFDLWIDHLNASPVRLVGHYEWYMINSNQYSNADDAIFTYSSSEVGAGGWSGTINGVTLFSYINGIIKTIIEKLNNIL